MENSGEDKKFVDTERESVNKTFAGEKAKLAQMSFSEKVEYIVAYYKLPIIGILAVIAIIIFIIHNRMTYVTPTLYGMVINSNVIDEQVDEEITSYLRMGKHEGCNIQAGMNGGTAAGAADAYNPIYLNAAVGSLDFVLTDDTGAKYMCDLGLLSSVEDELPSNLEELWSDRIVTMSMRDPDSDEMIEEPVAIDISGTKVHEFLGLNDDTTYLMICDLSGNHENVVGMLDMFYDIEAGTYEAKR